MRTVLMFNHHPDVLHYAWRVMTELGFSVSVANESLTRSFFPYSSTKGENKFEVVNQLFDPEELFPDMSAIKFQGMNGFDPKKFDIFWSMLPEIKYLEPQGIKTWYDCQMQGTLRSPEVQKLPGMKTTNHPDAYLFKFWWMPNWISRQGRRKEAKYITQLITELDLVDTTPDLKALRKQGKNVKIYGGDKCPDGFARDIDVLPHASVVIHNKDFGCNCYVVCKALDMGIPVYMSKKTQIRIGFGDLPKECFIYQEDYSVEEAGELGRGHYGVDSPLSKEIQEIYRSIYTLERSVERTQHMLEQELHLRW